MSYQDIIAAFVVGLLIGSGDIFGGIVVGFIYNRFIREESD
jgi:F0F1-type ATP synthase membrane subunit c/vacuolar-type H+-ATPase subunit K